jgi:hypothetical protein
VGSNKNGKTEKREIFDTVLQEAQEIIYGGEKSQDYGTSESFMKIAQVASILCELELSPFDCCKVLIAVKIVREAKGHRRDNCVDLSGYASLLHDLHMLFPYIATKEKEIRRRKKDAHI